jgi:hypothetical protein
MLGCESNISIKQQKVLNLTPKSSGFAIVTSKIVLRTRFPHAGIAQEILELMYFSFFSLRPLMNVLTVFRIFAKVFMLEV